MHRHNHGVQDTRLAFAAHLASTPRVRDLVRPPAGISCCGSHRQRRPVGIHRSTCGVPPPLEIGLLGEFRLCRGGEPLETVTAPRLQELLGYLALHRSAPIHRAHVAFVFWPDSTEKQALTNLRHLLHRLRKELPDADHYVPTDTQTLRLQAGGDVNKFREALSAAEAARRKGDSRRELQHLLDAADLYRGDLLPSCYAPWIDEHRMRLRQEFSGALEALVHLLESRREYASAIRFARRLQRHEPLREPTYRTLMRLHALAGDRGGMLGAYHECCEMLQREFGSGPAEATEKLHRQLVDGQAPASSSTAGGEHPLVGRFREWEQLKNAWRRALEEGSLLVVITGEAGIGKTRLMEELLAWVRQQGAAAARTRSYAAEGRLAYAPIVDWLRSDVLSERTGTLEDVWLAELARILPEVRSQRPDLPEPAPDPETWNRRRLFDALVRAVRTAEKPLFLALDDMQWTDETTLAWLRYLLRQAPESPLLIGGTIRTEEIEPGLEEMLDDIRIDGRLIEVSLGPLSAAETAEIARHLHGQQIGEKAAARLQAETEGNPLFIVEMVRVALQDHLADGGNGWRTPNESALPPKVHAVMARRLRQLSYPAKEIASLAAVLGRSFSADVLEHAGDRTKGELATALDELWRRRIIEEESIGRYDFTHDKLREVAYMNLSPERRRLLHLRAAEALRATASVKNANPLHVAAHYEQAGQLLDAAAFYRQAADAARLVYAGAEAEELYRRALALLQETAPTSERTRLELAIETALGACLVGINGYPAPEVRRAYERARTLSENLGLRPDAPILRGMALSHISGADLAEAHRLGSEITRVAEKEEDPVMAVEGRYVLGVTAFWRGRLASSRKHLDAALGMYDPSRRPIHTSLYVQDPGLVCGCRLALTLWFLGEVARARDLIEQTFEEARALGHPHTSAYVLCYGTQLILELRDARRAEALTEEAQALAAKHGFSMWHELALMQQGWARALLGELEEGADQLRSAMEAYERIGNVLMVPQYLAVLSDLYRQMDRIDAARAALGAAFEVLERRGERYYEAELYRLRGELGSCDPEAALRRAVSVATENESRSLAGRAVLSLARRFVDEDRADEAQSVLSDLLDSRQYRADTSAFRAARTLLDGLVR